MRGERGERGERREKETTRDKRDERDERAGGAMSDEDDEPVEPLRRQSTGMLLALPAEETEANDEKDGASGHCADLLLVLDDGNEWSTSVDVSYTIEFVKALAREHFAELKEAPALVRASVDHIHSRIPPGSKLTQPQPCAPAA